MKYFIIYLVIINIVSFVTYYVDKRKAERDRWRIKERTLHLLSIFGGVWGSMLAMKVFHHKNKKPQFFIITILALILNLLVYYLIFFRLDIFNLFN